MGEMCMPNKGLIFLCSFSFGICFQQKNKNLLLVQKNSNKKLEAKIGDDFVHYR